MAYKSLLTFLAIEEPNEALDSVIELANASGAHLDIIVLGVLRSPPVVLHDVAPATEWAKLNRDIMDSAFARIEQIDGYVASKGVSATVAAECDYPGNLEKIAARYALCADLHVVHRSSLNAMESVQKAFNGTLFDARCPILLLPEKRTDFDNMSKIAIAWNGRAEASHAVRSALPLIRNAERVNIIAVDPIESDVGQDPGSDLAAHLSRYGVDITVDVLASGGASVVQKLKQRALDIDADLLVMGGYGHTKLRQWLLGGATREILETADLPVFLVH
ncbi:MAG: universal stress protein [Pseudomonadota bacterium]